MDCLILILALLTIITPDNLSLMRFTLNTNTAVHRNWNYSSPNTTPQENFFVRAAIINSVALHISGRKIWFTGVPQAACNLPFSLAYDLDLCSLRPDYIDAYSKMVFTPGRLIAAT